MIDLVAFESSWEEHCWLERSILDPDSTFLIKKDPAIYGMQLWHSFSGIQNLSLILCRYPGQRLSPLSFLHTKYPPPFSRSQAPHTLVYTYLVLSLLLLTTISIPYLPGTILLPCSILDWRSACEWGGTLQSWVVGINCQALSAQWRGLVCKLEIGKLELLQGDGNAADYEEAWFCCMNNDG